MTTFNNSTWKKASALLVSALILPVIAQADHVKLYSADGSVEIVGELIGVEHGTYAIMTVLGKLNVPIDSVICEGKECAIGMSEGATSITGSD